MKAFDYISVATIKDACSLLAQHGDEASVLAGGTDLLIEQRRPAAKTPKLTAGLTWQPEIGPWLNPIRGPAPAPDPQNCTRTPTVGARLMWYR